MVQIDAQSPETRPEKGGDRRAEILRRAAAVFREKGFHGAGMREIAAGLGMAPGALYYYFESKDDLLHACQDISLERLLARGREIAGRDLPADRKLRTLIAAHLDLTLDELGGSAAHVEFHALPDERLREIVAKRDRYERLVRDIIRHGVEERVFRPVDVKLTTLALLGALNWTIVWWDPEGRWSPRDLVEGFADTFVNGLKARDTTQDEETPR